MISMKHCRPIKSSVMFINAYSAINNFLLIFVESKIIKVAFDFS